MAERPILNHSEMVYGPGDREAATALFEAMGFRVEDIPGFPWLIINIDDSVSGAGDNVLYAQESTPAQQNYEAALQKALDADSDLADKLKRYRGIRREHPQYVFHFGASVPTHEDWLRRVDILKEANESHPLLKGRIDMVVKEPGVPGALGPLSQAFIHSDIIQVGPLQHGGLLFDLQFIPDADDDTAATVASIVFPDRLAMV